MEDNEKLIRLRNVAELIGTTETHIRSLVAKKHIPFLKIGGRIMFSPAEIKAWLKDNSFNTKK